MAERPLARHHSPRVARCAVGAPSLLLGGVLQFGVIGGRNSEAVSGAMNMAGQPGSFLSSVCFVYPVECSGSYDLALMPLAAMLIVSGCLFAAIDPGHPLPETLH